MESFSRRLLAEALGTFGFFFFGFMGIAVSVREPGSITAPGVAAGFGLGLAAMIFAFGHISGGHFNPAVTLGLGVGGRFPLGELPGYWLAQITGGVAAAGVARVMFDAGVADALPNAPAASASVGTALAVEAIATFLFLLVIMTVATDESAAWKGVMAPVAIGGFLFLAGMVIGPISGGSLNPARSLTPALLVGSFDDLWIYIVGPLAGGTLGALVFRQMRGPGSAAEVGEEPLSEPPVSERAVPRRSPSR